MNDIGGYRELAESPEETGTRLRHGLPSREMKRRLIRMIVAMIIAVALSILLNLRSFSQMSSGTTASRPSGISRYLVLLK